MSKQILGVSIPGAFTQFHFLQLSKYSWYNNQEDGQKEGREQETGSTISFLRYSIIQAVIVAFGWQFCLPRLFPEKRLEMQNYP
jgi:hypothetical protein